MPEREMCIHLHIDTDLFQFCCHPLAKHLNYRHPKDLEVIGCRGCPCHEPAPVVKDSLTPDPEPAQEPDTGECCVWEWRVVPMSLCATVDDQCHEYRTSCGCWEKTVIRTPFCPCCGKPVKIAPQKRGEETQGGGK